MNPLQIRSPDTPGMPERMAYFVSDNRPLATDFTDSRHIVVTSRCLPSDQEGFYIQGLNRVELVGHEVLAAPLSNCQG